MTILDAQHRQRLQKFLSVIPLWIRVVLIVASAVAAIYWSIEHDFTILGDGRLGFLIVWLALLAPIVGVVYLLAWYIHRKRRRDDFPRAIARER
ncbi:MAG TPA: hypothetical protein VL856_20420 [Acidimicrobiia bacterium]|nr:hypothetical protein [Acidimicrobiia bacterium]